MKIRRAKIVLAGFVLFLTAIVVMADSGRDCALFRAANAIPHADKAGHLLLFGFLSFLVNLLQRGQVTRPFGFSMLKGSAIVLPLVTLEEASQVLFRTRSFDLFDLASDVAGIWLCGRLAVAYLAWKRAQLCAPQGSLD